MSDRESKIPIDKVLRHMEEQHSGPDVAGKLTYIKPSVLAAMATELLDLRARQAARQVDLPAGCRCAYVVGPSDAAIRFKHGTCDVDDHYEAHPLYPLSAEDFMEAVQREQLGQILGI